MTFKQHLTWTSFDVIFCLNKKKKGGGPLMFNRAHIQQCFLKSMAQKNKCLAQNFDIHIQSNL